MTNRRVNFSVLFVLVVISLLSLIGSIQMNPTNSDPVWWSGLLQNFSTEMMGAVVTFILFELIVAGHQRQTENEQQRQQQQRNAISRFRQAVTPDRKQIILEDMMQNDLLRDAYWVGVDLEDMALLWANLENTYLMRANFTNAALESANLKNTNLKNANLTNTGLVNVNLAGACLLRANLMNADLQIANLEDAELIEANLLGANLENTRYNTRTILPDAITIGRDSKGRRIFDKYWTPETDMSRYTDPTHPDFWEPDWVKKQREQGEGKY